MAGRVMVSGRWVSLRDAHRALRAHAPGRHSQKSHGGGGGSDYERDVDEELNGVEGDASGFGVDAAGVSYTEFDLDEAGQPRFSGEYREKYGPVVQEYGIGAENRHTVTVTQKGSLQVTDDSAGTQGRVVVQEFKPAGARSLSNDISDVAEGVKDEATNRATGVRVEPNDHLDADYNNGVDITWSNGTTTSFNAIEAVELAEGLMFGADDV